MYKQFEDRRKNLREQTRRVLVEQMVAMLEISPENDPERIMELFFDLFDAEKERIAEEVYLATPIISDKFPVVKDWEP